MINWRLFSHKFFNSLKMLLSSSWVVFIRVLVFSFSPKSNFSSLKSGLLVVFICTSFSIHSYLVQKSLNKNNYIIINIEKFRLCIDTTSINCFWYNKSQSHSFFIQLETTMQWLQKFEQKIRDKKFYEKYWKGFLLLSRFNDVLAKTFFEIY